jgi:hypothetical protein
MQHRKTPISIAFTTTFYLDGEMTEYQEETMMPLNIGDGFLWSDGTRYRVVDRWLSFDHHGHFNESLHVFLESVEPFSEDDRLGNAAPEYFREL